MKLKRIIDPNDVDLKKYREFLVKYYSEKLVDPIEVLSGEIEETMYHEYPKDNFTYPTPHYILVAKENNNIIAAAAGNFIRTGRGTSKHSIGFNSYSLPEEDLLVTGSPALQTYNELEKLIKKEAKNQRKILEGILVETSSPKIYSKIGYGRIQLEDKSFIEYKQPSLAYNENGKALSEPEKLLIMIKVDGMPKEMDSKPIKMAFTRLIWWYTPYPDEESHYLKDGFTKRDSKVDDIIYNNVTDLFKNSINKLSKIKKVNLIYE